MESLGDDGKGDEGALTAEGGLECSGSGEFRFSEWEGGEVTFLGSFVKVGEKASEGDEKAEADGLESFKEWLNDLA